MDVARLLRKQKQKMKPPSVDPPPASSSSHSGGMQQRRQQQQPIELGTIEYYNISPDGKHGDFELALQTASERNKPIFANFVEWAG
jgi:hypothetical protein